MHLLIGTPVLRREWVIGQWFDAAITSARQADVEFSFVFLGGHGDPTWDVIDTYLPTQHITKILVDEPRTEDVRDWYDKNRFHRMAHIRNLVLSYVRVAQPDYFLSVDSDIIVHPDLVGNLIETQQVRGWDAVGGYTYLSEMGRSCPSYVQSWPNGPQFMQRSDIAGQPPQPCVGLMAIKLMAPNAYLHGNYGWHTKGEDMAWSESCRQAGLKMGIDPRVVNAHVMRPDLLRVADPRSTATV